MFHVLTSEWEKIDYWRINKFMMLFRDIMEEQIKLCKHFSWKVIKPINQLQADTILNVTETQVVQGILLNFVQIYV